MILPKIFASYVTPALRYALMLPPELTNVVKLMQVQVVFPIAGATTISDELVAFVVVVVEGVVNAEFVA